MGLYLGRQIGEKDSDVLHEIEKRERKFTKLIQNQKDLLSPLNHKNCLILRIMITHTTYFPLLSWEDLNFINTKHIITAGE